MAVTPLDVATDGYLDSPLSVATDGYLSLAEEPVTPPGGGGFKGSRTIPPWMRDQRWRHPMLDQDELEQLIEREDEEILAIIMAAMRILH